jgi:H+/gluconate symporter-like permease
MSKRGKFWLAFTMLTVLLLLGLSLILLGLRTAFQSFSPPASILQVSATRPVGITLLAFVIALSVYLRQLASGTDEKRDKILKGELHMYPIGKEYTKKKLAALNRTHDNMHVAAPFLMALCVTVAVRILIDDVSSFGFYWTQKYRVAFKIVDFLILEWWILALLVLSVLHLIARRRDENIREEACRVEEEALLRASRSLRQPVE